MFSLLVILFVIKLYARNNTFQFIKKKHGQSIIMIVISYKSLKTKLMKAQADIKFIKSCKKKNLIPTFTKINLTIKNVSRKLKLRIARIIMESEMENKNHEKKKPKKEILAISNQLKGVLGLFLYNALVHKIELAVKSRFKSVSFRQQKKLLKFPKVQTAKYCYINPRLMKFIVHNFSSYNLMHCHMDYTMMSLLTSTETLSKLNLNRFFKVFYMIFPTCLKLTK